MIYLLRRRGSNQYETNSVIGIAIVNSLYDIPHAEKYCEFYLTKRIQNAELRTDGIIKFEAGAGKMAHWITTNKMFYKLREILIKKENKICQIIKQQKNLHKKF